MTIASPTGSDLPLESLPARSLGQGFAALAGVKVLDLTTSIAGPYAAMLLGDFGADVVKVERIGLGDDARAWGPPFLEGESLWFLSVNRNKRSLALDITKPDGLQVLEDLAVCADVMLVNQPQRVLEKLEIDPPRIRALNPRLIYVALTGFGLDGERADWTCYDLIAEGYSGVMDLTGEAGGEPQKVGAPAADMLAGQDATTAVLAQLIARGRNGEGSLIDIALVDSMVRFLTCRIVSYLGSGETPTRSGGKDSVIAIYQTFNTADHPITLGLGNDNIWRRFWEAAGAPEEADRPGLRTNEERRDRRSEVVERIGAILRTRPRSVWLTLLREARIPAGPINRVDEVTADEHLLARGLFYRVARDGLNVPQVGTAIRIDGRANEPKHPPPAHGAHTREVLREWLDYEEDRITALERNHTIEGRRP